MKAGTNLEKVLESGAFALTAEVGPPKDTAYYLESRPIAKTYHVKRG